MSDRSCPQILHKPDQQQNSRKRIEIVQNHLSQLDLRMQAPKQDIIPSVVAALEKNSQKGAKSPITTHILDTAKGRPAKGVEVRLEIQETHERATNENMCSSWKNVSSGISDSDGRILQLTPEEWCLNPGLYRLTFSLENYFMNERQLGRHEFFYPSVQITFQVSPGRENEHYHVPLLINPFGYSTYRGS